MPTTIPTTTTTVDPFSGVPLLQRVYNTHNNGVGEATIILLFVAVILFAVVTGYMVGRYGRYATHG